MDPFDLAIKQQLVASVLKDKCSHCDKVLFSESWCTMDRVVRFTTPYFRDLFAQDDSAPGVWNTTDCVMFEATIMPSDLKVQCLFGTRSMSYALMSVRDTFFTHVGAKKDASQKVLLKEWHLGHGVEDADALFDAFDVFLATEVPAFEKLAKGESEPSLEEFEEGEAKMTKHIQYERNRKAREACLKAHGCTCAVCGADFVKQYGPEFAGKIIEVHHIVPISTIGESYVVNPEADLVPVCPNCHSVLHSKPGGVYTIEEVRKMRK